MKQDKYDKEIKKVKKFAKNTPLEQLWNLDYVLSTIIYHKIRTFRKRGITGMPGYEGMTLKKWKRALKDIETGFKIKKDIDFENEEQKKKTKKAFKLFAKYYDSLWN